MKLGIKLDSWKKIGGTNGSLQYLVISNDEMSERFGRKIMKDIEDAMANTGIELQEDENNGKYPTTIYYEFYDENDDFLPQQEKYRSLLSFEVPRNMKKKQGRLSSLRDLKNFQTFAEENKEKVKEKVRENTDGKFELLDIFVDYEIRGSYCIIFFQYKIKPTHAE
jgi:hypothetical protein